MNSKFLLRNVLPDNPNLNFIGLRYIALILSAVLVVSTFIGLYFYPLNLGIDFTGGVLFEVRFSEKKDLARVRSELNMLGLGEITIQSSGQDNDALIKIGLKDEVAQQSTINSVKSILLRRIDKNTEFRKVEFVGAEVGSEMIKKGFIAVCLTFVGIIIYIWLRFNWQYSIGIAVGLAHDILLTIGFLVLTRYEFNLTSIAAILTILGYSVNDTVVIYDRVREKVRTTHKMNTIAILNSSINETLSRTLLTVFTTLLAAGVLIFIWWRGFKKL